jgi:DNA-binding NarL/FixJ family response regulator
MGRAIGTDPDTTRSRPSGKGGLVRDDDFAKKGQSGPVSTKVFLVDDHELVRRGVRQLIDAEPDLVVVGESGTSEEACRRIPGAAPDVAVVDLRLPDGDGIQVCREVRSRDPSIHCLILTSYGDEEAVYAAILAGADGYVLKHIFGSALIDGIRRVAAGESLIDPTLLAGLFQRLRRPSPHDELASLTDQERTILELIGEGLTNRSIGERTSLSEQTIKNYASQLFAKLGLKRRTEAAALATRLRERHREGGSG